MKPHLWLTALALSACGVSAGNPTTPTGKLWIDQRYPAGGTSGTKIALRGENFGGAPGKVLVEGREVPFSSWANTAVTFAVPELAQPSCATVELVAADDQRSNRIPLAAGRADLWVPTSDVPMQGGGHTAAWSGKEMIVWGGGLNSGGRYNPQSDSWLPTDTSDVRFAVVQHSNGIWLGDAFYTAAVFDEAGSEVTTALLAYSPALDRWRRFALPAGVSLDFENQVQLLALEDAVTLFGASACDGAGHCRKVVLTFSPETGRWAELQFPPLALELELPAIASTGKSILIWGTKRGDPQTSAGYQVTSDGAWKPIRYRGGARMNSLSVWSGDAWYVFGGVIPDETAPNGYRFLTDGARYDPVADHWESMPGLESGRYVSRYFVSPDYLYTFAANLIWTGNDLYVVALSSRSPYESTYSEFRVQKLAGGGRAWESVPTPRFKLAYGFSAVWDSRRILLWGADSGQGRSNQGMAFDPAGQSWHPIAGPGAEPGTRFFHSAVWTGSQMLVWGGFDKASWLRDDGARYDPVTNTWLPLSTNGAPAGRENHTAIWSGKEMIIWGGGMFPDTECFGPSSPGWRAENCASLLSPLDSGARYDPATDSWRPMQRTEQTPEARYNHSAVWTGERMIVWGGHKMPYYDNGVTGALNTGGIYDPQTDAWSPVTTAGAPTPRAFHAAVWTGEEMIVWGGSYDARNSPHPHWFANFGLYDGASYHPKSNTWTPLAGTGAPHIFPNVGVATGKELVVWGTHDANAFAVHGAAYDWETRTWRAIADSPPLNAGYAKLKAVWTGSEVMIVGGSPFSAGIHGGPFPTGIRYEPLSDVWKAMSPLCTLATDNLWWQPAQSSAFWTGRDLLHWAGDGVWRYFP